MFYAISGIVGVLILLGLINKIRLGQSLNAKVGLFSFLVGIIAYICSIILPFLYHVGNAALLLTALCIVISIFKKIF